MVLLPPPLRDVLQNDLHGLEPARVPELHRRAAQWHAHHDFPLEAVPHALASEDTRSQPTSSRLTPCRWLSKATARQRKDGSTHLARNCVVPTPGRVWHGPWWVLQLLADDPAPWHANAQLALGFCLYRKRRFPRQRLPSAKHPRWL